ncbi:MAG: hypothetical protein M3133_05145, partial [Actinomycetota bacterium]|nr:hypothetical protein [Actinomycetota bacterium]
AALFRPLDGGAEHLTPCDRCFQPTTGRFCAFCRARAQILGERLEPPADEQVSREISEEVLPVEVYGGRPGSA